MRTVICALLVVAFSGCTGIGEVRRNQVTIPSDAAVVAFSVKTGTLLQFDTTISPQRLFFSSNRNWNKWSIAARPGKTRVKTYILEVSEPSLTFHKFIFTIRSVGSYETVVAGPEVQLRRGEITYLGRLELQDVQFDENSKESKKKPIAVKLVFANQGDSDLLAWKEDYKLFQERVVNHHNLGFWGDLEYTPVKNSENFWALVQLLPH